MSRADRCPCIGCRGPGPGFTVRPLCARAAAERRAARGTCQCDQCGGFLPLAKARKLHDGTYLCRECDTSGGDDWHANERWNADGTPRGGP